MSLGALVRQSVRRSRRELALSSFGIAVGIASLAFFLALGAGVRRVVLGKIFHVDRIEVEPAKSTLDFGGVGSILGGGPRPISDDTVAKLRALPGVRRVAPRMRLAFPAKAWGGAELLGSNRYAELLGEGLDPQAVEGERFAPEPFADLDGLPYERGGSSHDACNADPDCKRPGEYCAWDVHQCQRPVPMLVSRVLIELYNSGFAPSHGLPRVSDFLASRFRGFTFTVELGTSFMGAAARGTPRQRKVMLVGISDRAIPIGVSLPLGYVQRWNAEYAGAAAGRGYTQALIEVGDEGDVVRVAAAARALGLAVIDSGAEKAGLAITLFQLLFALVSLAILAVATLNIAHTFFRAVAERRREIGVLRAVGASAGEVKRLLYAEAALIGFGGGAAGLATARLAALALDAAAARWLPDFPFKPDSYFHFSPALCAATLGFAVVACVAGAALPARRAAKMEPAEALAAR